MAKAFSIADTQVHEHILNAAQARFLRYGYTKTTMAEIADDVGMSAANLYRYFDNKQDIAAACASRFMSARLQRMRHIVRDSSLSPPRKIVAYALALVAHTHEMADEDSLWGEMVEMITRERPRLVHDKIKTHQALLAEILSAGNDTGEFEIDDVIETARAVYTALVVFDVPLFIGLFPREEFERRAESVATTLIEGLRKH